MGKKKNTTSKRSVKGGKVVKRVSKEEKVAAEIERFAKLARAKGVTWSDYENLVVAGTVEKGWYGSYAKRGPKLLVRRGKYVYIRHTPSYGAGRKEVYLGITTVLAGGKGV